MDKRTFPRRDFQQDATLIINNRAIDCNVQNISCAGALIRVDTGRLDDPALFEIGIDVEIAFSSHQSTIKGKILRLIHDGNIIFFAMYFLDRYEFE